MNNPSHTKRSFIQLLSHLTRKSKLSSQNLFASKTTPARVTLKMAKIGVFFAHLRHPFKLDLSSEGCEW